MAARFPKSGIIIGTLWVPMCEEELMVTKRQLGYGFALVGLLAIIGSFGIDILGAGQFQGIGPAQRKALLAAGFIIFIGLTLIPLGDRPA